MLWWCMCLVRRDVILFRGQRSVTGVTQGVDDKTLFVRSCEAENPEQSQPMIVADNNDQAHHSQFIRLASEVPLK
ncbi:hypothetical protein PUN28_006911 [Cardiocondyla obscurior]|uniref:Uncharacterized protein n=1 Tax=Cardiocondyla obscurior TaxID=286306 RepID=A0AAW2G6H4_9HYME